MNKNTPTLLITGGAGFIGSNFVNFMVDKYPDYHILTIDKLTYAGTLKNLTEVENHSNFTFVKGDITDEQLVHSLFSNHNITGIIHFAAESHVDRSIEDGTTFVTTNVLGTHTLLQAAKDTWEKDGRLKENRFHHISTDEVYGTLGEIGMFSEETPYNPRNPYSATKAGSNMLVKSFGYTYGMNVIISSCSNNYGPKQHREKLIPTIIANALEEKPIPIYGDGKNIRDWIYVEDHAAALDVIFHKGKQLETYNVGGGNEKTNIDIATKVCEILDGMKPELNISPDLASFKDLLSFTEDRPGHDLRYAVDDRKLRRTLGWEPKMMLEDGLKKTVEWYVKQWTKITP